MTTSWVLFVFIFYGSGTLSSQHMRFDTREACEAAYTAVQATLQQNLETGYMHLKHVCVSGASRRQGD